MGRFYCRTYDGQLHRLESEKAILTRDEIQQTISQQLNLLEESFYWTINGRTCGMDSTICCSNTFLRIHCKLLGGKGGFGSMLRSIGAQIEKTTNREACRDLSGRRMRDVNNEKVLAEWVNAEAEKRKEIEERRKERIQRVLNPIVKPFEDDQYTAQVRASIDNVEDALKQGLKHTQSNIEISKKRKATSVTSDSSKKLKTWFDDSDNSTDADDEDSSEDDESPNTGEEGVTKRSDNKEISENDSTTSAAAASSPAVPESVEKAVVNAS